MDETDWKFQKGWKKGLESKMNKKQIVSKSKSDFSPKLSPFIGKGIESELLDIDPDHPILRLEFKYEPSTTPVISLSIAQIKALGSRAPGHMK